MNLEDNKKAFMELLRIPSVTGSGADGEEKACAFLVWASICAGRTLVQPYSAARSTSSSTDLAD